MPHLIVGNYLIGVNSLIWNHFRENTNNLWEK
jgi:hypothetical protein